MDEFESEKVVSAESNDEEPMYERRSNVAYNRPRPLQLGNAEERVGPVGARSKIYRRGDHLEIDIPASGFFSGAGPIFLSVFLTAWVGFQIFFCIAAIGIAAASGNPLPALMILGTIPFWFVGVFIFYLLASLAFMHTNLIIGPTEFRIKRTLEFKPAAKDSVNHPERAAEELTRKDRLFCKQATGRSRDLTKAEVKTWQDKEGRTQESFVLWEGAIEHNLNAGFSNPERDWLLEEINSVIESIKQPQP